MPPTTYRHDAAWLLVALWCCVFLVAPCIHLVGHQDDHVHLPGGGVVFAFPAVEHDHGDGKRHHHLVEPSTAAEEQEQDTTRGASRHGAGSPEHLSVLLLATAKLVVDPSLAPLPETVTTLRRTRRVPTVVLLPWQPRAPPGDLLANTL